LSLTFICFRYFHPRSNTRVYIILCAHPHKHKHTHTHTHYTPTHMISAHTGSRTHTQRARCKYINSAASDTPERHRARINESDKNPEVGAPVSRRRGKLIKSNRQITSRDTATTHLYNMVGTLPPPSPAAPLLFVPTVNARLGPVAFIYLPKCFKMLSAEPSTAGNNTLTQRLCGRRAIKTPRDIDTVRSAFNSPTNLNFRL